MSSVEEWCAVQGIEAVGDLAYFFTTYEEARQEVGEAFSQAWLSAQTEASGSCKGLLLDLYACQSAKAMPHATRLGFYWSCPRFSVFEGHDFGQAFANVCSQCLPAGAEIPHRVA